MRHKYKSYLFINYFKQLYFIFSLQHILTQKLINKIP